MVVARKCYAHEVNTQYSKSQCTYQSSKHTNPSTIFTLTPDLNSTVKLSGTAKITVS